MKIAIGSDHAGFDLKEKVKQFLTSQHIDFEDFGTFSTDSVDYPDYGHQVSNAVENHETDLGILICGTGNGMALTANKHKGIRAGLSWNPEIAALIRQHNNANILVIPGRFVTEEEGIKIVKAYLDTDFEGGRHQRRIDKLEVK